MHADDDIDFDWDDGSTDDLIPSDGFSVHWTRSAELEDGTDRFTVTSDDGVRLSIDGAQLIDCWYDMTPSDNSAEIEPNAGTHTLRVAYYENQGDASAKPPGIE